MRSMLTYARSVCSQAGAGRGAQEAAVVVVWHTDFSSSRGGVWMTALPVEFYRRTILRMQ